MSPETTCLHPAPLDWVAELCHVSRVIRRQLSERYASAGLSENRVAVLLALSAPVSGFTQSGLAQELGLSESNLCDLIERMRLEGLLERQRSPLDRRKSVLTLTETGQDRCRLVRELHGRFEQDFKSGSMPELQETVSRCVAVLSDCLKIGESATASVRRVA
jgi:Transcriptional regulators